MAKVGFVGLGMMGSRVAKRLLEAGHDVAGHNRTKAKAAPLIDAGMRWAETPSAAAEAGDFVFTMVRDTAVLEAVTCGDEGILAGLHAGGIHVDMSTVSPAAIRALAVQHRSRGTYLLDAPVSGSVSMAEAGALTIMVGGERAAFERAQPILLDIGQKAAHVGPSGAAAAVKIGINLMLPVQILSFAEGLLLAEKSGVPRETAVEVMLNSAAASPALKYRGQFVLDMPEEAWFDVAMMKKDLALALDMGDELDVPLLTATLADQMLSAAKGMGLGDKDFAILFEVLARLAGVGG